MKFTAGYLILSFLSGFVELGAVISVIRDGQPLYYVPLMGLAYQLGALFREPAELASWHYYLALLLSVIPAVFASQSTVLLFLAVLLLSIGIQGARGMISERRKVSTFVKRVSRVAGFACSGLLSSQILPAIASIALLVITFLARDFKGPKKASIRKNLKPGPLGWIMTIHQSHYFSYAYVIPLLFVDGYEVDPKVAGLLFCIGWLSYISSQGLFGERTLVRNFAIGHILAAVSLAGIFFYSKNSLVALLALWFLTGFGGGTVYCLRKLRARSTTDKSDLDSWENMGHILGVLMCLMILGISETPELVFAVAALIAATTCVLFLLAHKKQSTAMRGF